MTVPGNVRHSGCSLSLATTVLYGFPKATCQATPQATLGIFAGCGSPWMIFGEAFWLAAFPWTGALGVRATTVLWVPEGDVAGNVPGHVRHLRWLRLACFWMIFGIESDGEKAWRRRLPHAMCQATFGILAGGLSLDWSFGSEQLERARQHLFRRRRARLRARPR